ncbi:MAG: NTP transferase domain-containing protein [Alphaproteobacteria bacterium]|nr:NTP transferase domain-containing protein [Alphaproteobacteria bacterium]
MKFGDIPVCEAAGAILAHSLRVGGVRFRKGSLLSPDDVAALEDAGIDSVTALRMEPGDLGENEAAGRVAEAVCGDGLTASAPATGRCNLYAERDGLAVIDAEAIDAVNAVDESVTIATVPRYARLAAGELAATVKIITFAVPGATVTRCRAVLDGRPAPVQLAAFRPMTVGLVQTRLPGIKESVIDKAVAVTRARLAGIGATLAEEIRCDHDEAQVADALKTLRTAGRDVALALGASAIADRLDVVPAAILRCGGEVEHFGMPVDPGNLMLLARIDGMRVLGLPGSARSPRLHGFDWVLERVAAGIEVTGADLAAMGVGGLLKEIPGRPMPRDRAAPRRRGARRPAARRVAALVLAAGRSQRMGSVNKLLADIGGKPMVAWAVEAALASSCDPVVVVTGHEPERVHAALARYDVILVHNPGYAEGLSTSLRAGLAVLDDGVEGAMVCLGDMPDISSALIDRLVESFDPDGGAAICVPSFNGKRGNPVLWARRFFAEMGAVTGDVGARHLIGEHEDAVREVAMPDDAVLNDLDTPAALAAHKAAREAGN